MGFFLDGLSKKMKNSIMMASVLLEIQAEHLANICLQH
jgi:hypothetical protein